MSRLSNIRIGIKLSIMSGLGILLVLGMIFAAMHGNSSVKSANENANQQQAIALDVVSVKASVRGMQIGMRDLRLALTDEELKKASDYIADRQKSLNGYADSALALIVTQENRERVQKLKSLADQYVAGSKDVAKLKSDIFAVRPKDGSAPSPEIAARIAEFNQQANAIVRNRTLPLAQEMDVAADKTLDVAKERAAMEKATALQEMVTAERIGLGVGILTVVLLLGSAIFGALSIARPLGKIAGVLNELTHDRIVDVPYADRGDEVGDIAKATEIFKQSIAEKVTNLRVKSGLDVVRSNVMIADDQYNIMYMNSTLQEMMRGAEAELRKALPNFNASKLIGTNMDVFHKNVAHQRKMMDGLSGSVESHIAVGTLKFHLVATAVMDKNGKRAGTVIEWRNETAEKAIETEVDNLIKSAVAGDFSLRVPTEGKAGFMLNLTNAMNSLCVNIEKVLQDMIGMFSSLADGDFRNRITADYQGSFGKLKDDANMMADRISATISDIKASAREVTNASAEISTSTTDLSQRTEEQAASLEETSASMEEISATVKKNAENAQQANQSAGGTQDVANRGGQVVAKAVDAMAKIEESSRKISDIIGVIDEIARQTNLLALNAAVEAARAGEAGRGFAVVASEVRSLAQRSSQAAKDIKDLITNSNGQVKDGVELVNRAGTALTEIVESIKKVAEIVSDIASASAEQATGLEQINKALTQMDEVTQQNSALVEENAATAKTLEEQAKAMDERVAFFRIDSAAEAEQTSRPTAASSQRPAVSAQKRPPAVRPKPQAAPRRVAANGGPVGRIQTALATAVNSDPDWKEF